MRRAVTKVPIFVRHGQRTNHIAQQHHRVTKGLLCLRVDGEDLQIADWNTIEGDDDVAISGPIVVLVALRPATRR
jgi:hypothetical protein